MAKKTKRYSCQKCSWSTSKWQGQCDGCGSWNSIEEEITTYYLSAPLVSNIGHAISDGVEPLPLSSLETQDYERMETKLKEFNHVCGGGIVQGAVMLIGGEPGIGKSTLLLQICSSIKSDKKPLYISGEEAAAQVGLRAKRLGISTDSFNCAFGTNLESIYALLEKEKPSLVIIDSIQTMHYAPAESNAGTVGQIRACAQILTQWAKSRNIALIMVGHITKEGAIAGPKILEHMVDVVLYFEGERTYPFRMLRSVKNRFGATDEVGIFEMSGAGLQEVENPSKLFLSEGGTRSAGTIVFPSIEGTRPLLVEIQALTLTSFMQMPRRAVVGWDQTRLAMICAVIETKLKMQLSKKEIYINIAAGLKIAEPASDLAAALAIMSSASGKVIDRDIVAFGELSLSGDIRHVGRTESRIKEAQKLGFKTILSPYNQGIKIDKNSEINVLQFKNIVEVWAWLKQT